MNHGTIKIYKDKHGWKVQKEDEIWAYLVWDEMLGLIAELTHDDFGFTRLTPMSVQEYEKFMETYYAQ